MKRMKRFFCLVVFGVLGASSVSAQYILNQTAQQSPADFNISGTGTANIFNAASQYNINGVRALSVTNSNTITGWFAGNSATTPTNSSFYGALAGYNNTTGVDNAFFGFYSGYSMVSGYSNSFFGASAGYSSANGLFNTFVGHHTGFNDTSGSYNTFLGAGSGYSTSTGNSNTFVGYAAGNNNLTGFNNVFFGRSAGMTNTNGYNNTLIGANANVGSNTLSYATAIGAGAVVSTNNTILLGRTSGSDKVVIYGLGLAGSTSLCRNSANQISTCSSSLRYKTNIAPFSSGLALVKQLSPIAYQWKDGGMKDVGFGAEDVALINPLFVSYNDKGEVEGVKYDRLSVAFVNAFKEQQSQIERQQKQIDALKELVCSQNRNAKACKE